MSEQNPSQFWADLAEDLKNPEYRKAYEEATLDIEVMDKVIWRVEVSESFKYMLIDYVNDLIEKDNDS